MTLPLSCIPCQLENSPASGQPGQPVARVEALTCMAKSQQLRFVNASAGEDDVVHQLLPV
jgi:hypothetical protein